MSVCGEMAGDVAASALLLGHGSDRILDASGEPAAGQARGAALRRLAARAPGCAACSSIDDPVRMRTGLERLVEQREPLVTRRWEDAGQADEQAVP